MTSRGGVSFEEADVVANYAFRPPYPAALFNKLVEVAPAQGALLDIGCGPGKISRPLAAHFASVVAVDPSAAMLSLAQSLPGGDAPNLEFIQGLAEEVDLGDRRFDLTVAAASIHWMDLERLMPRLRASANPGHLLAIVSGDDAFEPPWHADWLAFLRKWVPAITGEPFDPPGKARVWEAYRSYLDIVEDTQFVSAPFAQSIEDFIACQHSRDTFAPSKLGSRRAAFDDELRRLLAPHADGERLSYRVRTRLVLGRIKPAGSAPR